MTMTVIVVVAMSVAVHEVTVLPWVIVEKRHRSLSRLAATVSAMAMDEVKPGDSIPNRLIKPPMPC